MNCYLVQVNHKSNGETLHRRFYFNSEQQEGEQLTEELNRTFVALGITELESFATQKVAKLPFRSITLGI